MNTKRNNPCRRHRSLPQAPRQWWAAPAAFLATVLALPASAGLPAGAKVELPDSPLTTASRIPPNVTFVLDNSGSMALVSMPALEEDFDIQDQEYSGTSTGGNTGPLPNDPHARSYLNNTIYYDPRISYNAWMTWNGEDRMTGGLNIDAVFKSWNMADTSLGTRDLRSNIESIFYVPNSGVSASKTPARSDYVAYWVQNDDGTAKVVKASAASQYPQGAFYAAANINGNNWQYQAISVPSGATKLVVTTAGTNGNADLYIRQGNNNPTTTTNNGSATGAGSSHVLTINNPASGNWRIGVYNNSGTQVQGNKLQWLATPAYVEATPANPGRTQAKELTNIATWYSYYRTRIKTAKGGASEAFSTLDSQFRVGFTEINNGTDTRLTDASKYVIPVDSNKGVFDATNKQAWFTSLTGAVVEDGSTPLRRALDDVGGYYERKDNKGPWGPAPQYSCRQNFTILTTDGYWNSDGNSSGIGDFDGTAPKPFSGPGSGTLADIAYYYWKTDLRGDMNDNVPAGDDDPATYQHMTTFTISIGLRGTLNPATDLPALKSGDKSWPNPSDSGPAKIDDLWHAAVNGHGDFVVASNPTDFADGLIAALTTIAERTSSFSNVAASSVSLDTGAMVFNASYRSGVWYGTLKAYGIGTSGVTGEQWTASIPATGRNIFTFNGTTASATPDTTTQINLLARPTGYPITGADNWAYIKGDRSKEKVNGGKMRNRVSLLGDIVGSSPAYVKETGGAGTLYVGANDGMLHAFDASDGKELFAFVPSIIDWAQLGTLSAGDYTHQYFVDGPVVVSSRSLTGSATVDAEKNILVGSLGRGGRGLYSLNVGTPSSVTPASAYNWEVKQTDTAGTTINMGQVLSKPVLGKVSDGGTAKNAVIVGNGVNSATNTATLIVLDLDTGKKIQEIDTATGSATSPNGLFAPTGVYSTDGKTIRYVYAGDLLGNVWKFDLKDGSKVKLFTAVGTDGSVQSITGGVAVATNPLTNDLWVLFGTGRFLELGDASSTTKQSMYGIIDDKSGATLSRTNLTARAAPIASGGVRTFATAATLPSTSKGWYVDLPDSGERIVQDVQVVSTYLLTASMVPLGDPCEPDGRGYINALDAFTGTSAYGSYFDLDKDGTADKAANGLAVGSIVLDNGMPTLPNLLRGLIVVGGTKGTLGTPKTLNPRWDRVSWREVRTD